MHPAGESTKALTLDTSQKNVNSVNSDIYGEGVAGGRGRGQRGRGQRGRGQRERCNGGVGGREE